MNEPTNIPTPRTDELQEAINNDDYKGYIEAYCEMADFARTLERENIELKEQRQTLLSKIGHAGDKINDLQQQLTAAKEEIAKLEQLCVVRDLDRVQAEEKLRLTEENIQWYKKELSDSKAEVERLKAELVNLTKEDFL